ncbi:uncharacterized protein EI97DRAFT_434501 [Westerdykella ornata]|uniref:Uncharacterized protein n=1 Tax=Westerdykella ornata TaxID=318751 RepID=A0A6A6JG93_WESOR|nr:uncharacterized protein EI97DRAFT_434501 [Westerdykella ornata]KAF2275285.1 hypothetical protein EI97DRAFT_434501 [Westerdykella ornata]
MQYSTVILAALAASGSLGAPLDSRQVEAGSQTNGIRITLEDQSVELGRQFTINGDGNAEVRVAVGEPEKFAAINVSLGDNISNKELRCQARGLDDQPIVGKRGPDDKPNIDVNFSDAGKGPWTFLTGKQVVKEVVCSPEFKKITPEKLAEGQQVLVHFRKEKGDNQPFTIPVNPAAEKSTPSNTNEQYKTVEIEVGKFTDPQSIRCQVFSDRRLTRLVRGQRGENIDTSFADGDKGEWDFLVHRNGQWVSGQSKVRGVFCSRQIQQKNAAGNA